MRCKHEVGKCGNGLLCLAAKFQFINNTLIFSFINIIKNVTLLAIVKSVTSFACTGLFVALVAILLTDVSFSSKTCYV